MLQENSCSTDIGVNIERYNRCDCHGDSGGDGDDVSVNSSGNKKKGEGVGTVNIVNYSASDIVVIASDVVLQENSCNTVIRVDSNESPNADNVYGHVYGHGCNSDDVANTLNVLNTVLLHENNISEITVDLNALVDTIISDDIDIDIVDKQADIANYDINRTTLINFEIMETGNIHSEVIDALYNTNANFEITGTSVTTESSGVFF